MKKEIKNEIENEEDDEMNYLDYVDVDKKEDKDMWPTNLLIEIYGERVFMRKDYCERLHKEIIKEKQIEEELNKALCLIDKKEKNVINSIFKECLSIRELSKKENMPMEKVAELQHSALRKLRNPRRIKGVTPYYSAITDKFEKEYFDYFEEEAKKIKCSACGKTFDIWDYQEDFSFDKWIGYGSNYDEQHIEFKLCCDCFDKIFDIVKPMIKNIKIEEYDAFEKAGCTVYDWEKNPEEFQDVLKIAEETLRRIK